MTESNSVTTPQIEELIVRFIEDELVGDESLDIDSDENLLAGGIVDSVGLIRLITHIREKLGISVPPQDLIPENFRTIRIMASYLQNSTPG